ncbi:MAG: family 43 glycosylhydrolase [Microbacteriaceae bacterium]
MTQSDPPASPRPRRGSPRLRGGLRASASAAIGLSALLLAGAVVAPAAAAPAPVVPTVDAAAADPAVFYNPVISGADPSIVLHEGAYYSVSSTNEGVFLRKSTSLTTMDQGQVQRIWTPDESGALCCNIWAPDLTMIDGEWYIYFAADDGNNANHRMYGITPLTDDPFGAWSEPVKMAAATDRWAIDASVMQKDGELYFLWSGWENEAGVGQPDQGQELYIARMSDPLTIEGDRVQLSAPTEPWERIALPIQEGPETLIRGDKTIIVYSASGSWTEDYCLGTLTTTGDDMMDPSAWTKSDGCVFSKGDTAWGPGHHTFTTSPDGAEEWIVYHASTVKERGWPGRSIRAQPFTWNADDSPAFGTPVTSYDPIPLPSGDDTIPQTTYEAEDAVVTNAKIVTVEVPGASGGKKVGGMDFADSSVEFTEVTVPQAGTYGVHVRYSNGMDRASTHQLSVNEGAPITLTYPNDGWDNFLFTRVEVDLVEGANTLRFIKGDGFAELDMIRVDTEPIGGLVPEQPEEPGGPEVPGEPEPEVPGEPGQPPVDGSFDESDLTEATRLLDVLDVDEARGTVTVRVPEEHAGARLDFTVFSEPVSAGSAEVSADAIAVVRMPDGLAAGQHRLAASVDGQLVGWDAFSWSPAAAGLPGVGAGDGLAATGTTSAPLGAVGVLLALAGLAALVAARVRRVHVG